jgi:hypothetical protein
MLPSSSAAGQGEHADIERPLPAAGAWLPAITARFARRNAHKHCPCASQIQTRDIAGFLDTRYQLLQIRANNRTNWLGFAVAHHLSNNFDLAVQVLEAYESTVDEIPDGEAYEHSELLLYKAMVLQEGGRAQEALHLLVASQVAPTLRLSCAAGPMAGSQLRLF